MIVSKYNRYVIYFYFIVGERKLQGNSFENSCSIKQEVLANEGANPNKFRGLYSYRSKGIQKYGKGDSPLFEEKA